MTHAEKLTAATVIATNPINGAGPICLDPIDLRTALECPAYMLGNPDVAGNDSLDPNLNYWEQVQYLTADVRYRFPDGSTIVVKSGFPTDGASIPSFVAGCTYERFDRKVLFGAILHDACYASNLVCRETADVWLQRLWESFGVPHPLAHAMKLAVGTFGHSSYADSTEGREWYLDYVEIIPAPEAV